METKTTTLASLRKEYGVEYIPYIRLLKTEEWAKIRGKVVDRDKQCCTKCCAQATVKGSSSHYHCTRDEDGILSFEAADKPIHLEVHHTYYMANKMPWEYPKKALVTLCNWCHQELHDTTRVPFYGDEGELMNYTPCSRCSGSGSFPEYNHVSGGTCFRCGGARYEELIRK